MKFENTEFAQIDFDEKVPYLSFPVLTKLPYIKHGFSTKLGGVSEGIFYSMNLGMDKSPYPDKKENIIENYNRMAQSIGVSPESLVISKQVHKTNIRVVEKEDLGKGLFVPADYEEIDGLITNQAGITLVTKYADCVPLYLVDTKRKVIGLSHSGWRGTVQKIGKITVQEMNRVYGSEPKDIIAVIGPSICRDCYEIGVEVATEFESAFQEVYEKGILTRKENGKYLCDLWAANLAVFEEAGLPKEHCFVSGVCTCCNHEWMYSHRKTGVNRGSLAAFLALSME